MHAVLKCRYAASYLCAKTALKPYSDVSSKACALQAAKALVSQCFSLHCLM